MNLIRPPIFLLFGCFLLLLACGKGTVEIDQSTYEPKIVINGLLYPGQKIDRIKIMRNFPLNTNINFDEVPLPEAVVEISDENNTVEVLEYNALAGYFQSTQQKLLIEGGQKYRLDVTAEIDGKKLSASSVTQVPELGFKIDQGRSCHGDIPYRSYYINGLLVNPCIIYNRSKGAEFYALSGVANDADLLTFIEGNVFGVKKEIVEENINYFKYFEFWSAPDSRSEGISKIEIPWWFIYFYGQYRIILYAGDVNFYHFFSTHRFVQDMDGNLREPLFYITGEGIGLFGSAITDTLYFSIIK